MGNIETGEIGFPEAFRNVLPELIRPVEFLPAHAAETLARTGRAKIGRNDPCFCGSGKKFKRCCMRLPKPVSVAEKVAS